MGLLEILQERIHGQRTWPPTPEIEKRWEKIAYFRARFENDAAYLIQNNPYWHPNERRSIFTPVPLAREMAKLSADLLFTEAPKLTLEENEGAQDRLDKIWQENAMAADLHAKGRTISAEGRGAYRIIWDETALQGVPIMTFVNEDQVVWDERHGKIVVGGSVVIERVLKRSTGLTPEYWRLIEQHEPGVVFRKLYRGEATKIGSPVALENLPAQLEEFEGLLEEEETRLDVPTLVRWDNAPGGTSDIEGIEVLLDRLDEYESSFTHEIRRSLARVYADRSMADEHGRIEDSGVILTGGNTRINPELGSEPSRLPIEVVQPDIRSGEYISAIGHLVETSLMMAGYSLASYGLDRGGSADSGKALKLRQSRTLLTRMGKERMARAAIEKTLAIALAMDAGASDIEEFRPKVEFGDGLPEDTFETAQELQILKQAQAISTLERIRRLHPAWTEEAVEEELARIQGENAPAPSSTDNISRLLDGGLT